MDVLAIFTSPEAWISLATLFFLEIVLGVDNIVFIVLTTNRLPEDKQRLGRRLGLLGALCMRILFLCFASFLTSVTMALFTFHIGEWIEPFTVRDAVLGVGGVYLIYKGLTELHTLRRPNKGEVGGVAEAQAISLPMAIGTIMVMDIVFSIDSVITAVGLAEHLIIMIIAVIAAVLCMIAFINIISDFINSHYELQVLALVFITVIGILLLLDSIGIHSNIEVLDMRIEKLLVYIGMLISVIVVLVRISRQGRPVMPEDVEAACKEQLAQAQQEQEQAEMVQEAAEGHSEGCES